MTAHPGILVTFDGNRGSGKTTQVDRVAEALEKRGYSVVSVDIPVNIGGSVRRNFFSALSELSALYENTIRPSLEEGKVVLVEHYVDTVLTELLTNVETESVFGLTEEELRRLAWSCVENTEPDFAVYMTVWYVTARSRTGKLLDFKYNHKSKMAAYGVLSRDLENAVLFDTSEEDTDNSVERLTSEIVDCFTHRCGSPDNREADRVEKVYSDCQSRGWELYDSLLGQLGR